MKVSATPSQLFNILAFSALIFFSYAQQENESYCTEWKWDLNAEHRCNIKQISMDELQLEFPGGLPPLYHQPLVITQKHNSMDCNSEFYEMTSLSQITKFLPDNFNVTLSSSNSFSAHRRMIPLEQYINETTNTETFPNQLSNETWYLFGETYSKEWQELLKSYCLPPCQTCTRDLSALAFGIGGKGTGVQWHIHGPGFSQSLHGRKHWVLYPQEKKPSYDPDYTSRYWLEEVYSKLSEEELPWECTLFPGDMIYFPDHWHHATLNLDPYTVFVSTFTTEHGLQ